MCATLARIYHASGLLYNFADSAVVKRTGHSMPSFAECVHAIFQHSRFLRLGHLTALYAHVVAYPCVGIASVSSSVDEAGDGLLLTKADESIERRKQRIAQLLEGMPVSLKAAEEAEAKAAAAVKASQAELPSPEKVVAASCFDSSLCLQVCVVMWLVLSCDCIFALAPAACSMHFVPAVTPGLPCVDIFVVCKTLICNFLVQQVTAEPANRGTYTALLLPSYLLLHHLNTCSSVSHLCKACRSSQKPSLMV